MAVVLVDVIFFVLLLVLGMLWLTISTSGFHMCFYSFQAIKKNWKNSETYCQQKSGNLVSMETEEEYQFINKKIQSLDVGNNEWYVGLTKISGDWKWISGHNMTIDKWRPPDQPNREHSDKCVKMIKYYRRHHGLFDNVHCGTHIYSICEYQKVSLELKKEIEKEKIVFNHTCYDGNDDVHTSAFVPTSNTKTRRNSTTEELRATGNVLQPTTYTTRYASTATPKTVRKAKSSPIMFVVIVLAVLLAACMCIFVGVLCWFRRKSEKELNEVKSARNPSKRHPLTRSLGKDQSNPINANSGCVRIVGEDTVHFLVPVDDIDYPRFTTPNMTQETEDLSTYAEVYDAIQPSAKMTSKYYDVNDIYLNPVDTAPTSSAQVYENVEFKPHQDVETREKGHQQVEKTVAGQSSNEEQCLEVGAVDPAVCNNSYATNGLSKPNKAFGKTSIKHDAHQECKKGAANEPPTTVSTDVNGKKAYCKSLYATTDLSKPNKAFGKTSTKHDTHHGIKRGASNEQRITVIKDAKGEQAYCNSLYATTDLSKPSIILEASEQGQEQKRRRDGARAQPVCCDNLYATIDLDANAYEDELRRTQSFSVSTSAPSYSNNPCASSGLTYLQDKYTEVGLGLDGIKDNAKKKSRHPSIDSIMSASRKTKNKPSIPNPYKEETGDTMMYAVVDLLNNDEEARPVYSQVKKKHKK